MCRWLLQFEKLQWILRSAPSRQSWGKKNTKKWEEGFSKVTEVDAQTFWLHLKKVRMRTTAARTTANIVWRATFFWRLPSWHSRHSCAGGNFLPSPPRSRQPFARGEWRISRPDLIKLSRNLAAILSDWCKIYALHPSRFRIVESCHLPNTQNYTKRIEIRLSLVMVVICPKLSPLAKVTQLRALSKFDNTPLAPRAWTLRCLLMWAPATDLSISGDLKRDLSECVVWLFWPLRKNSSSDGTVCDSAVTSPLKSK